MFDSLLERLLKILVSVDQKTALIGGGVTTGIVLIASGGVYYVPYLTLNTIKNATTNRNSNALAQEIDFPALRVSIKENIQAQLIKKIAKTGTAETAKITPEIIKKMVSLKVDKVITPEGVEQLMLDQLPETKLDLVNLDRDIARSDIQMGYESFDRFVIRITNKVDRTKDVSLILKRSGLAWKLSGIDISKLS
jgi:Protein of unknown function (DUF2939)